MLIEEAQCTQYIQIAESGQKALNYLTNSGEFTSSRQNDFPCPDLIFLDVNMPAMNGWEFLARYKELKKQQKGKMIIIMLTTSLNPDDQLRAVRIHDIAGFENKPMTAEMIDRILRKHFAFNFESAGLNDRNKLVFPHNDL